MDWVILSRQTQGGCDPYYMRESEQGFISYVIGCPWWKSKRETVLDKNGLLTVEIPWALEGILPEKNMPAIN